MVPKDKQAASAQVGRTESRNHEVVTLPRGIPTSYVGVPSPLHDQFRGLGRQDHISNAHDASVRAVEEPRDRGLVVFALLDDEFTTEIHFDIILLCIGEFIDFGNNSVADPEGEVPVFSRSACQSDARGHGTRYCAIFERNSWLDELRQAVGEAVYGYAWDNMEDSKRWAHAVVSVEDDMQPEGDDLIQTYGLHRDKGILFAGPGMHEHGILSVTGGGAPSRLRSFATRRRRRLFSAVGSFNVFPFTMLFGCYGRASVGRRMLSFVRARGRLPRFRAVAVSTGVCATSSLSCLACSATLAQVP